MPIIQEATSSLLLLAQSNNEEKTSKSILGLVNRFYSDTLFPGLQILVFIDTSTVYVEAFPTKTKKAAEVAQHLLKKSFLDSGFSTTSRMILDPHLLQRLSNSFHRP